MITDRKQVSGISFLFMCLYMVSYITRINYGAVISEMVAESGMTKSMLSMALTGSFITYGTGQIISGICGDRFPPKKLILMGLSVTVIMNILIPFCVNPYQMLAVWCVNGFAQAFMWPPLVRIMTSLLSEDDYNRASVNVSWGSSYGTIVVYFLAPLIIYLSNWKTVFLVSAVFGIIMLFIWNMKCPDVAVERSAVKREKGTGGKLFTPVLAGIMIAIVLQGMLRDGVTTWMPSYISETYNLSSAVSILTGVIMPVFSILSFQLSSQLYVKKMKNPVSCAGFIFGIGAVSALILYFVTGSSAAMSVLLSALITGAMHGVNLMLICYVPPFFKKFGSISTVSGLVNSCTYVGSAISTYGIALISEKTGWSFTIFLWFIIALLGTLLCGLCTKKWKEMYM